MKKVALIILDGWGHGDKSKSDGIYNADTPFMDKLEGAEPNAELLTDGKHVGLPEGQMGNSEVGHLNIGAGRVVYQELSRINKSIEEGDFYQMPALLQAIEEVKSRNSKLHFIGLVSDGGVHSSAEHLKALCKMAQEHGIENSYVHAFTDGRDCNPTTALGHITELEEFLAGTKTRLASIIGRYYAMDRDQRWDRVQPAYSLLTEAKAEFTFPDVASALQAAYDRDEDDEFVQATVIQADGEDDASIKDGDVVLFMNFRADRAREITRAFVDQDFDGFERTVRPALADFVMLTEYAADIDTSCAYPPEALHNVLGEYLASLDKTQLRIAETEKYAHVTFFFNGGREEPFPDEDRTLIPSPKVKTYDLKPEMSAFEVTDALVAAIKSGKYDAIICNYANGDMVGHTGDFDASVKAVEVVDECLGRIVEAIESVEGNLLVTADHGNVEQMLDPETGQPLTSHTNGPVPLVYVGNSAEQFVGEGSLCDIAPTLLYLMKLPAPSEMTGKILLTGAD